jgi:hypothetical protein
MGKKLCLCSLAVLLILALGGREAAAFEGTPAEGKNWAFLFGVTESFTLSNFENGEVSLKQCLSSASALRYSLGISYTYDTDSGENDDLGTRLSVMYQRYVNPNDATRFFWGVGPTVYYRYRYALESHSTSYLERSLWDFGLGVAGMAGVEWFATKVISLHAEYRLDTSYHWVEGAYEYKNPTGPINRTSYDYQEFDFHSSSVLFGLSVYF